MAADTLYKMNEGIANEDHDIIWKSQQKGLYKYPCWLWLRFPGDDAKEQIS